ncbi:MAG: DUF1501 domain-containing protein [Alphaproteobacteria bacterium]|nr:DUF1501 domain-containing protein [Alphaproteobacteria bacterium]
MAPSNPAFHAINRRSLLMGGCAVTLASVAAPAFAATQQSNGRKVIVVILRGAMDGMSLLPKIDDPNIHEYRAPLIDAAARPLDDGFALHSAFASLAGMYKAGEAAFAPATAGPYRERSHFEAQDLLESGAVKTVTPDGWLNRALQRAPAAYSAVSIGPMQPLIVRGKAQVASWSPAVLPEASDDTLNRLMDLYQDDLLLKTSLTEALGANKVAGDGGAMSGMGGGRAGPGQYVPMLQAAGKFLAEPDGPEIAVVSLDGWDTHAGQAPALQQRFTQFDAGLKALKDTMGESWKKTALVAVSEFGRTVRVNGAQGTDHGTAGTVLLAGGAIKGGRMFGDWPTLKPAALFENRDLAPANDARSVFKGVLREQLGWDAADLDRIVFPDSAGARPMANLV